MIFSDIINEYKELKETAVSGIVQWTINSYSADI